MSGYPRGFTLLELTLSISLVAILAAITVPLSRNFLQANNLDVAVETLAQSARRAQILAQVGMQDSDWGVKLESGQITLFSGSSFATRDPDFDEYFDMSPSIEFEGLDELVFAAVSGEPGATGSIQLSDQVPHYRVLRINALGVIDY